MVGSKGQDEQLVWNVSVCEESVEGWGEVSHGLSAGRASPSCPCRLSQVG